MMTCGAATVAAPSDLGKRIFLMNRFAVVPPWPHRVTRGNLENR